MTAAGIPIQTHPDEEGLPLDLSIDQESVQGFTEEELARQANEMRFPEWDSAIAANNVSFTSLAQAYIGQSSPDPVRRRAYARYLPQLLEAFESKHGATMDISWYPHINAVVTYTDKDKIYIYNPTEYTDLNAIIFQGQSLASEACRVLHPYQDSRICIEKLYAIITDALGILVTSTLKTQDAGRVEESLSVLKGQLQEVRDFYEQAAMRKAQIQYFIGMIGGIVVLLPLAVLTGVGLFFAKIDGLALEPFLGAMIAGGLGAVVSVMSRMTRGNLVLRYDSGNFLLRLLGGFRPLIGAVLGLAIYFLVVGAILPIQEPSNSLTQFYFYSAIAFIAGFSERWAQDMLVVAQSRLPAGQDTAGDRPPPPGATARNGSQTSGRT